MGSGIFLGLKRLAVKFNLAEPGPESSSPPSLPRWPYVHHHGCSHLKAPKTHKSFLLLDPHKSPKRQPRSVWSFNWSKTLRLREVRSPPKVTEQMSDELRFHLWP